MNKQREIFKNNLSPCYIEEVTSLIEPSHRHSVAHENRFGVSSKESAEKSSVMQNYNNTI